MQQTTVTRKLVHRHTIRPNSQLQPVSFHSLVNMLYVVYSYLQDLLPIDYILIKMRFTVVLVISVPNSLLMPKPDGFFYSHTVHSYCQSCISRTEHYYVVVGFIAGEKYFVTQAIGDNGY